MMTLSATHVETIAALVGAVLVIWLIYYRRTKISVDDGDSSTPSRTWDVSGGYSNAQNAAELIQQTHNKTIRFFRYIIQKYHIDETDDYAAKCISHNRQNYSDDLKMRATSMIRNYNPDVLSENDPKMSSETSYTVAKGRQMLMCVRQRDNPNVLSDPNTLMFTHLHELAHIANYNGWGHGPDFWTTFKWVLKDAVAAGVYTPVDYVKNPIMFCGLNINYQPLYDGKLPSW